MANLFSEIRIRNIDLKNRILMPPLGRILYLSWGMPPIKMLFKNECSQLNNLLFYFRKQIHFSLYLLDFKKL